MTTGITSPLTKGFLSGLGAAFGTGLQHRLEKGAVLQEVTSLHFELTQSSPSVSTHIAALRQLFFGATTGNLAAEITKVVKVRSTTYRLWLIHDSFFLIIKKGELPLVIQVHSADVMATLIELKNEVEARNKTKIKFTFSGASEAHLLAKEISEAEIGVILIPARPFPLSWKSRRM